MADKIPRREYKCAIGEHLRYKEEEEGKKIDYYWSTGHPYEYHPQLAACSPDFGFCDEKSRQRCIEDMSKGAPKPMLNRVRESKSQPEVIQPPTIIRRVECQHLVTPSLPIDILPK